MKSCSWVEIQEEVESFFHGIDKMPFSSALRLGRLFLLAKDTSDKEGALCCSQALQEINEVIKGGQLSKIWNSVRVLSPAKLKLLEAENIAKLNALNHGVLQCKAWFSKLPNEALIELGQDLEYTRGVLAALVQKHIDATNQQDSFEGFDYGVLKKAGHEQNSEYLASFISQCESLPIASIKALGRKNHSIARIILVDTKDHNSSITLGTYFANKHNELHQEIANNWNQSIQTLPLAQSETIQIKRSAKKLSRKFPEFAKIANASRIKRDHPNELVNKRNKSNVSLLANIINSRVFPPIEDLGKIAVTLGLALYYRAPAACLTAILSSAATPAVALIVPTGALFLVLALRQKFNKSASLAREGVDQAPSISKKSCSKLLIKNKIF